VALNKQRAESYHQGARSGIPSVSFQRPDIQADIQCLCNVSRQSWMVLFL